MIDKKYIEKLIAFELHLKAIAEHYYFSSHGYQFGKYVRDLVEKWLENNQITVCPMGASGFDDPAKANLKKKFLSGNGASIKTMVAASDRARAKREKVVRERFEL